MIRLMIVEDQAMLRDSLACTINTQSDMEVGASLGDALHMRKRFAQLIVRHSKQAIRLFKLPVQGLFARHVDSDQTAAPHTTQAHLVAHKQACFIRRNLESDALGQHLATLFARHIAKVGP